MIVSATENYWSNISKFFEVAQKIINVVLAVSPIIGWVILKWYCSFIALPQEFTLNLDVTTLTRLFLTGLYTIVILGITTIGLGIWWGLFLASKPVESSIKLPSGHTKREERKLSKERKLRLNLFGFVIPWLVGVYSSLAVVTLYNSGNTNSNGSSLIILMCMLFCSILTYIFLRNLAYTKPNIAFFHTLTLFFTMFLSVFPLIISYGFAISPNQLYSPPATSSKSQWIFIFSPLLFGFFNSIVCAVQARKDIGRNFLTIFFGVMAIFFLMFIYNNVSTVPSGIVTLSGLGGLYNPVVKLALDQEGIDKLQDVITYLQNQIDNQSLSKEQETSVNESIKILKGTCSNLGTSSQSKPDNSPVYECQLRILLRLGSEFIVEAGKTPFVLPRSTIEPFPRQTKF